MSDELTRELDAAVDAINADPARREDVNGFMTQEMRWGARMRAAREDGLAEGEVIGETRHSALVDKLIDAGRIEDLKRSSKDAALLQRLYAEYGL